MVTPEQVERIQHMKANIILNAIADAYPINSQDDKDEYLAMVHEFAQEKTTDETVVDICVKRVELWWKEEEIDDLEKAEATDTRDWIDEVIEDGLTEEDLVEKWDTVGDDDFDHSFIGEV